MIIVGVAVYFGIYLLEDKTRRLHADLLTSYAVQVTSQATIWRTKESPFIGGGGSYENLNIDGMAVLALTEDWPPGLVRITFANQDSLVITAISKYYREVGVRVHVSDIHIVQTNIAFDGSIRFPNE